MPEIPDLMIAGRLHWRESAASISARNHLMALDFSSGSLLLSEAGKKRQAGVHLFSEQSTLPGLRPPRPTDSLCHQRMQLLCLGSE